MELGDLGVFRMRTAVEVEVMKVYIYTWNLFVLYFWASTLQNKAFSNQNKGHLGSRYIYIYTYIIYIANMGCSLVLKVLEAEQRRFGNGKSLQKGS